MANYKYPKFKVVNLTGHTINDAMAFMTYPAEKRRVARVDKNNVPVGQTEDGGLIYETQYKSISGLPEYREGVKYIVSSHVLNAARHFGRDDCIAVNDVIRNGQGTVVGCKGFRSNG